MSKTITATNKATKALLAASVALTKQTAELGDFTTTAAAIAFEIEEKQGELANIESVLTDDKRKAVAELALAILENKEKQLVSLMKEAKLATISGVDLHSLESELATLKDEVEERISMAVEAALERASEQASLAAQKIVADHLVANASKDANITSLNNQKIMLAAQVTQLNSTIEAERKARVDIAASEALRPAAVAPMTTR